MYNYTLLAFGSEMPVHPGMLTLEYVRVRDVRDDLLACAATIGLCR